MRNRCMLLVLALGLGLALSAQPRQTVLADDAKADRVGQLIKQLGSPKFAIRDRAKKELESMGPVALEALRKAAKSDDMETSQRAGALVKKLEDKITIDNLLAPKKVNLKLKDVTVSDAIEELSKQSGYPIQVEGDRTQLTKRKITLETGDTTFWQAFDQLCQKGSLTEMAPAFNPYGGPIYGRGGLQPIQLQPIQIQPIQIQPIQLKLQPLPAIRLQPGNLPGQQKEVLERLQKALEQLQKEVENNLGGKLPPLPNVQPGGKPGNPQPAQMQKELQKLLEEMMKQLQKENPNLPPLPGLQPLPGGFNNQLNFPNGFQVGGPPVQGGQPGQAGQPGKVAIQFKAQQVQIAPPQQAVVQQRVQIVNGRVVQPNMPSGVNNGKITVRDGAPPTYPTSYAGAVRVRVVPLDQQPNAQSLKKAGEVLVLLEVSGEPRMQDFGVIGSAMIDKAVDNHGQALFVVMDQAAVDNDFQQQGGGIAMRRRIYNPNQYQIQRHVLVRLKTGEKETKTLKEFAGNVTAQMLSAPEALITFDNLLKAAGKEAKGPNGGKVEVVSSEKLNNGDVKVQVRIENVQNMNGMQNNVIRAQGGVGFNTPQGMATVRDAKGKDYQFTGQTYHASRFVNGVITQEISLTYRPNGAGEPAALVFNGHRMIPMQVPFSFKDLPLQ